MSKAFTSEETDGAEVVAVDCHERPVLTVRRVGAGRVVVAAYPFEHMASTLRDVNPEPTHQIYDALACVAGITRDVVTDDPRINVGELSHEDGRRFVWFVSQSGDEVAVKPRLSDGALLRDLESGENLVDVTLPPYGVAVCQLAADVT